VSVRVQNLSVRFGPMEVLHRIDLSVASGAWLGLIGPNGSGKTTLLRAIAGLVALEGEVAVLERDARDYARRELARVVAYVPQRPQLPANMPVRDYVMLGRTPHITYFGSESSADRTAVAEVLERLSLEAFAHRPVSQLSGGEAQRVVLARALAQGGRVLLLDEPTAALDLGHQQQVLELTDELRQERDLTVICAMHDLTVAAQYAERLALMANGAIRALGSAHEVLCEENVAKYFAAEVNVLIDDDGGLVVAPRRAARGALSSHAPSRAL
jgi:iron complex transport system ATP-binding protein